MRLAILLAASVIGATLAGVPATAAAQTPSDDWLPSQQHGIGFAKDPSGAIITKVVKDSPAERAGVTEGMVVTHIDGMPLRELTTAQIARLFAGSGKRVELKIRGSGTVSVGATNSLSEGGSGFRV